jgi:hypothetical protein
MNEVNQNGVPNIRKAIYDSAVWYAIIIPVFCAASFISVKRSPLVLASATFIFISALLMGVLSSFVARGVTRRLVFIGILVSAVFGGFAAYTWYMSGAQARFDRDMDQRYEHQCGIYYHTYKTSDIEGAKKALQAAIDFSLNEQSKAKYYWRFDVIISGSQARLAIIAEAQGNKKEADRLFASASDYRVLGNIAFREEAKRGGHISLVSLGPETNDTKRISPDQWRKWIAGLEKDEDIKWKSTLKSTPAESQ